MLTITIGCPGAGKSTWAENNLPESTLRLERDRFRECLFGSRRGYHSHKFERDAKTQVITQAMLSAMIYWPIADWAVTDTGLVEGSVKPFMDHAVRAGQEIEFIIFDRPIGLLIDRNRTRPLEHQVPEDLLLEFHQQFNDPDAWWRKFHPCRITYV